MNKTKRLSVSLSLPYDVIEKDGKFIAIVAGFEKMRAEGETEYLAKEDLRYCIKSFIQSEISQEIPLPKFLEVR